MKILVIILILMSSNLIAKSLIIYPDFPNSNKALAYLKSHYDANAKFVFSKFEQTGVELAYSVKNSIKVRVDKKNKKKLSVDKYLKSITQGVESNQKVKFFKEEYSHLQWGLHNLGQSIRYKVSDIDFIELPSVMHEDIGQLIQKETARKVRVAIIDSGIDLNHPDLKNQIYSNLKECEALALYNKCLEKESDKKICHEKFSKIDSDNNGYPMDCHGWNVAAPKVDFFQVQGNSNVQDLIGHGTFVAGVIGAQKNNVGVEGVIQNVEILPVKVSGSTEEVEEDSSTDIFAKGILYALKNNVDVINLSLGWASNEDSLLVTEMIKKANQMGVLVVVAGGNSAHSSITYPCSYEEVICVGSHNNDGKISHFSNRGSSIDLLAPGFRILSTWPLDLRPIDFVRRHGYEFKDGTSFSAPFVTGALAKLINLGMNPEQAKFKLLAGTREKSNESTLIMNGNLDIKKSLLAKVESFIYPLKKTPALINWSPGKKQVRLKLKNYIKESNNVRLKLVSKNKLISVLGEGFNFKTWNKNEVKVVDFKLLGPEETESDLIFELKIESDQESKSYPVQAIATTVVHENIERGDVQSFRLKSNVDLSSVQFNPFENISNSDEVDFLLTDTSRGVYRFALMKKIKDSYRVSKFFNSGLEESFVVHLAKLDIDLDQEMEYVLITVYRDENEDWQTKFFVFNKNFKPKKIEITSENTLENKLTTINEKIFWVKMNERIVPMWISKGYLPNSELPVFNPWEENFINRYEKRIYYVDASGLRSLNIEQGGISYSPHSFFAQTQKERNEYRVKLLFHDKDTFKKRYFVSLLDDLNFERELVASKFVDIENNESLEMQDSLLFSTFNFHNSTSEAVSFSSQGQGIEVDQLLYKSFFDPIQLVISKKKDDNYFALTKYNLLFFNSDEKVYITESRNTDRMMQYKFVKSKNAVYLPSLHTPGYTSELISYDRKRGVFRNSKYRFLSYGSCQEVGYYTSFWRGEDKVIFYCNKNKKIHFFSL